MEINVSITDKRAEVIGAPVIVCGNSDYTVKFTFDGEWSAHTNRTARFVFEQGGELRYSDVSFTGNTVTVPVLVNVREVCVGVFAGDLCTTSPACIPCERSIQCLTDIPADGSGVNAFAQLQNKVKELENQIAKLEGNG